MPYCGVACQLQHYPRHRYQCYQHCILQLKSSFPVVDQEIYKWCVWFELSKFWKQFTTHMGAYDLPISCLCSPTFMCGRHEADMLEEEKEAAGQPHYVSISCDCSNHGWCATHWYWLTGRVPPNCSDELFMHIALAQHVPA
jgi:hypothetical protein